SLYRATRRRRCVHIAVVVWTNNQHFFTDRNDHVDRLGDEEWYSNRRVCEPASRRRTVEDGGSAGSVSLAASSHSHDKPYDGAGNAAHRRITGCGIDEPTTPGYRCCRGYSLLPCTDTFRNTCDLFLPVTTAEAC